MSEPVVTIDYIGDLCPVQADGTVNGKPFYFRARFQHWSMSIGGPDPICEPEWYYEEEYGIEPFAAGYMPQEEARAFIEKAAGLYQAGWPGAHEG
jgi:hypothetical protein